MQKYNKKIKMNNAIIIGASSGIGREMALQLINSGCRVGITARRVHLLNEIKDMYPDSVYVEEMDLMDVDTSVEAFNRLYQRLGAVELVVVNSGTGSHDPDLDLEIAKRVVGVNVMGFTALVNEGYRALDESNGGYLVGVSSIAGIRGNAYSPTYPASKSYMTTYLEGLRCKSYQSKAGIKVIDVKPGFVDTAMGQSEQAFWRASTKKAVEQMLKAINRGKENIVVTKRWYFVAWLMKWIPFGIYKRMVKG